MAKDWGFIGGGYPHESQAIDAQRTVNLYPEVVESGTGKSVKALLSIPGLADFCTLPVGPIRQLFAQDGRAWAVAGSVLYELYSGGTFTARGGALINDGTPATIDSNGAAGHQLWVTSGGRGGVLDTVSHAWTPDVRTDATMGAFVDGYFVSLDAATSTVYASDLENGLTWNALSKAQRNLGSDAIVAMGAINRMLFLLGSQTSEVWYNTGASPFAFGPFQGGFLEVGCAARGSVAWCDNSLFWLGASEQGPGTVCRSVGFQAQRISTHALAKTIAGYATISDAVAFSHVWNDHAVYVLSFPTEGKTWAWDAASGVWTERAYWDTTSGLWGLYKPRFHAYAFGKHLVGDGVTGNIYELSATTYTDAAGVPLRRLRQGPYVVNENRQLFHRRFWLDIQSGVGQSPDDLYKAAVLRDNPVAYWRLGEASGTSGTDESGNVYTLTYTGSPTMGVTGPVAGGSTGITFAGNTSYAKRTMAVIGGTNLSQDFTIEAWVHTPDGNGGELVSQSIGAGTHSFIHLAVYPAVYYCEVANNAGAVAITCATSGTDYTDDAWHYVVATWDASAQTMKVYVDGTLKATTTQVPVGTVDAMDTTTLGTRWRSSAGFGAGAVDSTLADVALYQTALSAEQVLAHYRARTIGITVAAPQVSLAYSDDMGKTWKAATDRAIGAQGDVATRVEWRRLGRARQRMYQVVCSDAVPVRIADAYLEIDGGGGG